MMIGFINDGQNNDIILLPCQIFGGVFFRVRFGVFIEDFYVVFF